MNVRKFMFVIAGLTIALALGGCGKEEAPGLSSEPGIAPYDLTEEGKYILESFDMFRNSKLFSFTMPDGAAGLNVNVYQLDKAGDWQQTGGGGIYLGEAESSGDGKLEGTVALELYEDYSIAFHIGGFGTASSQTEPVVLEEEVTSSTTAWLKDFKEAALGEEVPVAFMAYDSGTALESCSAEDYFQPEKWSGLDLVQAVTVRFSEYPGEMMIQPEDMEEGGYIEEGPEAPQPEEAAPEKVHLKAGTKAPEGMTLYRSCPFMFEEEEWQLRLYVQEDMVLDGELLLDDRASFLIRAEREKGGYTLFEDTVQLGVPAADVWIDLENRLHITVRDVRTARYQIRDYQYDPAEDTFSARNMTDWDGINLIGSVEL